MKILLSLLIPAVLLASEPAPVKVAEIEYAKLPCPVRKENSGIYAIESFSVAASGRLSIVTSPRHEAYEIGQAALLKKASSSHQGEASPVFSADVFEEGRARLLTDNRDGSYTDALGHGLRLRIAGRDRLTVSADLSGTQSSFTLSFPGDLGYAELIGIDAAGRMFLLTERYTSEIPLKVLREVITLDSTGARLSTLEIPDIKYLSSDKDFRIDGEGNLYHMMTTAERAIIFKWTDLTTPHASPITYPAEYSYSLHYNDLVTTSEAPAGETQPGPAEPQAVVSRAQALRIAESYAMHQYFCSGANLAPANVTGPDGDVVRTAPWLLAGANARVPYMWGGYSTIAQFDAGLKAGKYAGDINTAGVSGYSVGVDCSGFVSRCWQTSHNTTSSMPGITTQYASWDSLKPGDAILKSGHVRLFIERTSNGGFRVVEAAGRNWDVSYYTFALSDLQGVYTPRVFNSMEKSYSFQRPTLAGVTTCGAARAMLRWSCDTTNIIGYRIYSSEDGVLWTLCASETTVGSGADSCVLELAHDAEYYRLSSVKNDPSKTESDWSNAMGASRQTDAAVRWLIVDGFERQTGSFQNPGHTLAVRYGKALAKLGAQFSTLKNSRALADSAAVMQSNDVIWFLGDESAADETFSDREQAMLEAYLQSGRHLFVTGSEVGWDLSQNGTASDKVFYSEYLKAVYKADNAGSSAVKSAGGGTFFGGGTFSLGQVYTENWPDEIDAGSGGTVCMRYANDKAAGVQYAGPFGSSAMSGKMIYLSFALETTASDSALEGVIKNAAEYFEGQITHALQAEDAMAAAHLELGQNYPNPFNPSTTIRFTVPSTGRAVLKVYNMLGQDVSTLFDDEARAGAVQTVHFDASRLASGIYFSRLEHGGHRQTRAMMLLK